MSVTTPALVSIEEVQDCDVAVKALTDPPGPPVTTSIDPVW